MSAVFFPLKKGLLKKERTCSLWELILSLQNRLLFRRGSVSRISNRMSQCSHPCKTYLVRPFYRGGLMCGKANRKSQKLSLFYKWRKICQVYVYQVLSMETESCGRLTWRLTIWIRNKRPPPPSPSSHSHPMPAVRFTHIYDSVHHDLSFRDGQVACISGVLFVFF